MCKSYSCRYTVLYEISDGSVIEDVNRHLNFREEISPFNRYGSGLRVLGIILDYFFVFSNCQFDSFL